MTNNQFWHHLQIVTNTTGTNLPIIGNAIGTSSQNVKACDYA